MNRSNQPLIEQLERDEVPTNEMQALLDHKSILVRANVLEAIARRAQQDSRVADDVVDDLVGAALDPKNRAVLMGTITISHVAVARLLRVGTPQAVAAARRLLDQWQEPDRSDLRWFLKSEGLLQKILPEA